MPYSKEHKQQSREKILQAAASLFTKQGYEKTSIDQVMKEANLTRGGFYAHFSGKNELYKEAISAAAGRSILRKHRPKEIPVQVWIQNLIDGYLSQQHLQKNDPGCPLAFMVTDIAIADDEVRSTYTKVFQNMNALLMAYTKRNPNVSKDVVMATTAMMIGAVAIGRAINDDDIQEALLESCRNLASKLLIDPSIE